MKGKIVLKDNELMVEYVTAYGRIKVIPIILKSDRIKEGQYVDFKPIDEFSHPNLFSDIGLFEGTESALILEND